MRPIRCRRNPASLIFAAYSTQRLVAAVLLTALSSSAFAHHPLGGETPTTFLHGLLSGIGHPVIGFDHLVFLIAAGMLAWTLGRPLLLTGLFIVASLIAVFFAHAGLVLPMVEAVVLGSILLAGFCLVLRRRPGPALAAALFAVAGIAHGGAYGGAITGAEQTPLLAYLLGIGVIQIVIVALSVAAIRVCADRERHAGLTARLVGAGVVGVALSIGVESLESVVLPLFAG